MHFSVLPVQKDVGMLVIVLNAQAVFTLDGNQCNFSSVYGRANLDLLSLFLLVALLSGFLLTSEIINYLFWCLHLITRAFDSPSVDRVSGMGCALALVIQTSRPSFRPENHFFAGGVKSVCLVVRHSNAAWLVPGQREESLCAEHSLF